MTDDDATDRDAGGDGEAGHAGDDVDAQLLRQAYGLDDDRLSARAAVLQAAEQAAVGGSAVLDDDQLTRVAAALADAAVALSVADALAAPDAVDRDALETVAVAAAMRGGARGGGAAGAAYVRARCAEHAGEAGTAESHLHTALEADPEFVPALLEAAWFAEDRGQAQRAATLLGRAGVEEDVQLARVQAWAQPAPARGDTGRNDPCPCGSQRKFKRCCGAQGGHPLEARAGWLLDKIETYARRSRHRRRLLPLVEARAGDPRDTERLIEAIRDPLVADLGLFEAGLLDDFLAERGRLLPADERELARAWRQATRDCYEVLEVDDGQGAAVADLRGGDRLTVFAGRGSQTLEAGETIFARLLPVGSAHLLSGGLVRVPQVLGRRLAGLLDLAGDARSQAAWVAALEGAPQLVTIEGEPTVVCRGVYQLPDAEAEAGAGAVREGLSARLEPIDGRRWVERVEVDGHPWSRGTVTLDGDGLTLEANAEAHFERLQAVVAAAAPEATLTHQTRRDPEEVLEVEHGAGHGVG